MVEADGPATYLDLLHLLSSSSPTYLVSIPITKRYTSSLHPFGDHRATAQYNSILIWKHAVHGTCPGTTINMKSKGPNYSNHNSSPGPVAELNCRLVLNLTQFPNPQSRLLFWAGCQAERTITNWFPTGGGEGGGWDPRFTSAGLKSSKHLLQTRCVDRLNVTSHKLILSFYIAYIGFSSREDRACWPDTDQKEHRGCGQSSFPMEVCKTSFSGTLKHQKANRLLTLLSPLSLWLLVFVCVAVWSVSVALSLSLYLPGSFLLTLF